MAFRLYLGRRKYKRKLIGIEHLKQILHYNPKTGIWTWLIEFNNGIKVGDVAGGLIGSGYIQIAIGKTPYKAHRLAWFYMTGKWPKVDIDHRDLNRSNNKWGNLREATRNQNMHNRKLDAKNTTGFKGVAWHVNHQVFYARIAINGKRIWLGCFNTSEEASEAYLQASKKLHKEFANA